jgi:subfamily B ATP-binding cassette protein MsbA
MLNEFKKALSLAATNRTRVAFGISLIFIGTIFSLVFPAVIREVLDTALNKGSVKTLQLYSALLLVIFILRASIGSLGDYVLASAGQRIAIILRNKLYAHLHTLDLSFFHSQKIGELTSRLTTDTSEIKEAVTGAIVSIVNQSFILVGSFLVMLTMSWRLTLFILILAPTATILSRQFGKNIRERSRRVQEENAKTSALAQESFSGIAFVKSHNASEYEGRIYSKKNDELYARILKALAAQTQFQFLITLLTSITTITIFWYGGIEVFSGKISVGELIAFLFYTQNITQAFSMVAQNYGNLSRAMGAIARVFELLDIEPNVIDKTNAQRPTQCAGNICFVGVEFCYSVNRPILKNLELEISPGEIIAFVGKSGVGKTTIVQLLTRLFDVTKGSIRIDENDIRNLSLHWLRDQIALVSQEVFLFGTSVRENIRYGRPSATDYEVEEAARMAYADTFIRGLTNGYDTEVGERGVKLSGGQKQRLALARAFLKRPRILVLDEATSGVDGDTEARIQSAIHEWNVKHGVTVIIITHRLNTVRLAKRVVVIGSDGRISEEGSVESLLKSHGEFCKLMETGFLDNDYDEEMEAIRL